MSWTWGLRSSCALDLGEVYLTWEPGRIRPFQSRSLRARNSYLHTLHDFVWSALVARFVLLANLKNQCSRKPGARIQSVADLIGASIPEHPTYVYRRTSLINKEICI